jgi:hypothetical protein
MPSATRIPFGIAPCVAMILSASFGGCAWIVGLEDHRLDPGAADAATVDAPADVSVDTGSDAQDASHEDASADVAIDPPEEQPPEASDDVADSGDAQGEGDAEAAAPLTITATISADEDDGMWNMCTQSPSDERLRLSPSERVICVSDDADDQCAGLRFDLSAVPAGATIQSAILTLAKVNAPITAAETIQVKVWDSPSTPAFNDAHTEVAVEHDPGATIWTGGVVQDWHPDASAGPTSSPDLSLLVQRVVDLPSWGSPDTRVTFLLLRQSLPITYVCFADSSSGVNAASLKIVYVP